jgi:UDP-glucose 4-epimerase
MRNLITGGAGFIGSHLTEKLLAKGEKVIVLDDLSTGDIKNIKDFIKNPNFAFIKKSLLDKNSTINAVRDCDRIFHLAAAVGVDYVCANQLKTKQKNILGTYIVAKFSAKFRKNIIFMSSSEVYSPFNYIPYREHDVKIETNYLKNLSLYGKTKLIGELIINKYSKKSGINSLILRLFNISGPKQKSDYGMVIPKFIQQALANEPITIYGDGKQTRTFMHVNDAVSNIIKLSNYSLAYGKTFNIGGTEEISITELAKKITEILKSSSHLKYIPYEKTKRKNYSDFNQRLPDLQNAKRYISYSQNYDLNQIISDSKIYLTRTVN